MRTTSVTVPRTARPSLPGPLRHILGSVLIFLGLNALAGGYYGMVGAPGVPVDWLTGTPFRSYSVPGLILFGVVGGSLLVGGVAVFARSTFARGAVAAAGFILVGWLAVQLAIIGRVSWMQPAMALIGAFILAIAWAWPATSPRSPMAGPA